MGGGLGVAIWTEAARVAMFAFRLGVAVGGTVRVYAVRVACYSAVGWGLLLGSRLLGLQARVEAARDFGLLLGLHARVWAICC